MNTELNKLLMVKHPERGIWYFTNINLASKWMGTYRDEIRYLLDRGKKEYKDYTLDWVDGSDVMYKYINPER